MRKVFLTTILLLSVTFCFAEKMTFTYRVGSVLGLYSSANIAFVNKIMITEVLPVDKSVCRVSFIPTDDKLLHFTEYLRMGDCVKIYGIEHTVKSFDYNKIELEENLPDDF